MKKERDLSKQSLFTVGLISAILSNLSWIVFVFGQMSSPNVRGIDDPLQYFQTVQDGRLAFLAYAWGGIFGTLLSVPYILAFYEAMKDRAAMMLVALVTALIGAIYASFGFFKILTLVYFQVPKGLEASPKTVLYFKIAMEASGEVFEPPWFIGSFLIFGLGFGLIAYFGWRTDTGPKWLNGIGIIGGFSGMVWLFPFLSFIASIGTILIIINILTIMIWSTGLSIVLVRQG